MKGPRHAELAGPCRDYRLVGGTTGTVAAGTRTILAAR